MHRILTAVAALSLVASAAFADVIRFEPPAPEAGDTVKVDIGGLWPDGCVPFRPQVSFANGQVNVLFTTFRGNNVGCVQAVTPWSELVNLGVFVAGQYTVVASVNTPFLPVQIGSASFVVREVKPYVASPFGAATTGGERIRIFAPQTAVDFRKVTSVRFDGVEAELGEKQPSQITVKAPAHNAGVVNLEVTTSDGAIVEQSAFIYYDRDAAPNPFVHEPILFPLSYSGGGAFGSNWTVENVFTPTFNRVLFKNAPPCDGCTTEVEDQEKLKTDATGAGTLLYAVRASETRLRSALARRYDVTSRLRETSQDVSNGTEVPVVREKDFRYGEVTLQNVPAVRNSRASVRVYALSGSDLPCRVATSRGYHDVVLTRTSDQQPLFAQTDITADLASLAPTLPTSILVSCRDVTVPVRSMLSITDNATQHVTIISPR